jgi:CubicO group peptidase (beta-lactamase class C family)
MSVPWGDRSGFGIDLSIRTEKTPAARAGEYGWTGMATTRFFVCPSADLIGLSFTQRIMDSDILTSPLKKTLLDSILDQ